MALKPHDEKGNHHHSQKNSSLARREPRRFRSLASTCAARCRCRAAAYVHPSPGACTTHAPAASNLRAPTRPMARRPGGERKDALDTAVASRRRCRAQVASVAAAASAASLGVKPQAEAPHSAPDAPRGALRRRLRRRTTCTARARTQRHRSVAARARAGPTWASERISSVARALQGARRKGRAGRWHPERLSSDAPEAGRSGAEARARAVATDRLDKFLDKWVDLLMLSAGPPEGGFVPKPPFHREHQDLNIQLYFKS